MRFKYFGALLAALLLAPAAPASVVTYGLDLSVPGEFQIFASASSGDNFGLACYGLPFTVDTTAMITSYEHLSPAVNAVSDGVSDLGTAGFTLLRDASVYRQGVGLTFTGSQDTINPSPYMIRSLGQTAGSFSGLGLTTFSSAVQPSWGDSLLIARGTYTGDANNFHIDNQNNVFLANVFSNAEGTRVHQAEVRVQGINGFDYTPLPLPVVPPPPVAPPLPVQPELPLGPPSVALPVAPNPVVPPSRQPRTTDGTRPVVSYNMDLSVPGEFKIFASASTGDNFGLACYGLPLTLETTAMLTSFQHVSPAVNAAIDGSQEIGTAGFTLLRNASAPFQGRGLTFTGSQDTINPTPHLISGIGQQPGSFLESGLDLLSNPQQPSWEESILIAQGTYNGDASDFRIDTNSADFLANVFANSDNSRVISADVHVFGTNGFSYAPQLVLPPVVVEPLPSVIEPPTFFPLPIEEPSTPETPDSPPPPVFDPQPLEEIATDTDSPLDTAEHGLIDTSELPYVDSGIHVMPWFDSNHGLIYLFDTGGMLVDGTVQPVFRTFSGGELVTMNAGMSAWATTHGFSGSGAGELGVPEPSSLLLAGFAIATLTAAARSRHRG